MSYDACVTTRLGRDGIFGSDRLLSAKCRSMLSSVTARTISVDRREDLGVETRSGPVWTEVT